MSESNFEKELNEHFENDYYETSRKFQENIKECVLQLKSYCGNARIPMFFSMAMKNSENGTDYLCECVLSSLEQSVRGNRIGKLLLVCNDADIKFPPHIEKNIEELTRYLNEMNIDTHIYDSVDRKLVDDKIRDYLDVVKHGAVAAPPDFNQKNDVFDDEMFDEDWTTTTL